MSTLSSDQDWHQSLLRWAAKLIHISFCGSAYLFAVNSYGSFNTLSAWMESYSEVPWMGTPAHECYLLFRHMPNQTCFWLPTIAHGFYCPVTALKDLPVSHCMVSKIFFLESLAIVSALHFLASNSSQHPLCIVIYTDSLNTVNLFNTLHVQPVSWTW